MAPAPIPGLSPPFDNLLPRNDFSHTSTRVYPTLTSYPTPTTLTSVENDQGGTTLSGLPDIWVWIFMLLACALVLLTGIYRVWRLRQLNRNLTTFFQPLHAPPPPPAFGHLGYRTYTSHTSYGHHVANVAYPPPAHVSGADVGPGGRRGGENGDVKEELPPYERGTLPTYVETWSGPVETASSPAPTSVQVAPRGHEHDIPRGHENPARRSGGS